MNIRFAVVTAALSLLMLASAGPASAGEPREGRDARASLAYPSDERLPAERLDNARHPQMQLREGWEALKKGEYEIIDLKGGITRALCPYSCKDRGLTKGHCRTWQSKINPAECYVQDTRI